jgi:hypothetical protein
MMRKLASGGNRLYSRKKDPKTGKRRNLGTFKTRAARVRMTLGRQAAKVARRKRGTRRGG